MQVTPLGGALACPYCATYGVERLYLAGLDLDACACRACGARWDERCTDGELVGPAHRAAFLPASRHRR